jgi:hypothetical protein
MPGQLSEEQCQKVGEVVIVSEEGKKRGQWRTGIVEKLVVGHYRVMHGAKIRTIKDGKPSRLHRPLQRLVPLEISLDQETKVKDETEEVRKTGREQQRLMQNGRIN